MGLFSKKAKDPVCGMTVEAATAAGTVEYGGKTFHFCSASCQGRFTADPKKFA